MRRVRMARRMGKRGSVSHSDKQIFWTFIVLPAIAVVFGFIIGMVAMAKYNAAGIFPGLEDKIIETRLLYSDKCFAYKDSATGRVYPGTIDYDKFTQQGLDSCVPFTDANQRALIVVLTMDGKEEPQLFSQNLKTKTAVSDVVTHIYPVTIMKQGQKLYGFVQFQHWH